MISWNKLCLIALVGLFSLSISAQTDLPQDFDEWIESGRKDWSIPGMAVGIVKDGEVVYAKGFGERRLGSKAAVDENTIFSIASVSKNMTAAALAVLVDEGEIDWDDKITTHIPWFQFKDPWVTDQITIRDALTHRVGLGRILGNRLQFMTKSSRDEVLYQMRYMDFEKPFRSSFVYNNIMYSLAGQVIEYTDGRTWDEFLQEELFEPVDMTRASTSITALENQENVAYPHQEINGEVVEISRRNWDNAAPAGGVNASISDLNKWMMMQLETPGTFENKTIVSKKGMNEIHKPQMLRGQADAMGAENSYGFGWSVTDYKGKRVITHGGATDGFNTAMYLLPELNVGVVVVGNTFNRFGNAVAYQVMDSFIGETDRDWNEYFLSNYKKQYDRAQKARKEIDDARIKKTKPTLPLDDYVGVFKSEAYGKVVVEKQGKDLKIQFWDDSDLKGNLEHWHYDTFRNNWENKALREDFLQFRLNKKGEVDALEYEFSLRPMVLQVGAYPSDYMRTVRFEKQ